MDRSTYDEPATAQLSPDPRTHIFFLSYARSRPARKSGQPSTASVAVRRFFVNLCEDVAQLLPLRPGHAPGFMDTTLEAGEVWSDELLLAAARCHVFVPLLSPGYIWRSTWCAMEWDLFAAREVRRRADDKPSKSTAIIPVLWVPISDRMPTKISQIQLFTPPEVPGRADTLYEQHGVFGLFRLGLFDDLGAVSWTLAQQIVSVYTDRLVVPNNEPDIRALRRSFAQEEP
jgi:hypothetical protein